MKFLIVGPGAMGCLFAACVKKAGFEVVLLDYIPERAALINEKGIHVEGVRGHYHVQVPTTVENLPWHPDLALICVKSYHTLEAARTIFPQIGSEPLVMTLQNGVGNIEILEEVFGKGRVLGGVTAEGATLIAPGQIRHAGEGETVIGPGGDSGGPVERIVDAFNRAGFETHSEDNVESFIWGKLLVNAGINPLTAITRLKNGRLPEMESTRAIMERAVQEGAEVAKAKNIHLPYSNPIDRVTEVCRATSGNMASMLQDVLKRKPTEIDAINGAIVREGEALGISTPVNFMLTEIVHAIQDTYQERID